MRSNIRSRRPMAVTPLSIVVRRRWTEIVIVISSRTQLTPTSRCYLFVLQQFLSTQYFAQNTFRFKNKFPEHTYRLITVVGLNSLGWPRFSVVDCGTVLEAGRSRTRFLMRPLHFAINVILPASLWPCGELSHEQK